MTKRLSSTLSLSVNGEMSLGARHGGTHLCSQHSGPELAWGTYKQIRSVELEVKVPGLAGTEQLSSIDSFRPFHTVSIHVSRWWRAISLVRLSFLWLMFQHVK